MQRAEPTQRLWKLDTIIKQWRVHCLSMIQSLRASLHLRTSAVTSTDATSWYWRRWHGMRLWQDASVWTRQLTSLSLTVPPNSELWRKSWDHTWVCCLLSVYISFASSYFDYRVVPVAQTNYFNTCSAYLSLLRSVRYIGLKAINLWKYFLKVSYVYLLHSRRGAPIANDVKSLQWK